MIEKLKKACCFDFDKKEAYGQIRVIESRWDGEDHVEITAEISLINSDMLNLELQSVEDNPLLYFYEFLGEAKINSEKYTIEYIAQLLDLYTWRKSHGMVKVTIYTEEEFKKYQNEDNIFCFYGETLFAESRVATKNSVIVIEHPIDNKELFYLSDILYREIIKNSITSTIDIIYRLNDIFNEEIQTVQIDIYNVAQASFNNCVINNNKSILFDIGVTRSKCDIMSTEIQAALYKISKLLINGVILSHWDLDHILGAAYTHSTATHCTWIAPDFRNLYKTDKYPLSVLRLCNYLSKNGCLCLIDTSQTKKHFYTSSDNKVNIWLGDPVISNGINKANNGGLLLNIENEKSILLTGDCENNVHPAGLYKKALDYIVIPHHGSIMSPPKARGTDNSTAYVSYGKKRGHCSLDRDLRKKYKRHNFSNLCRTKNLSVTQVKYTVTL